jgi:hypothetical protein
MRSQDMLVALQAIALSMEEIRDSSLVRFPLRSGEQRDFAFSMHNTIVIFDQSVGFRALFATGAGRVRIFGSRADNSSICGGFFGPNLGKMRIQAHADCSVTFRVLVPSEPCTQIFVSTGTAESFRVGQTAEANATDSPQSNFCFWHLATGSRRFTTTTASMLPADNVHVIVPGRQAESLGRNPVFTTNDPVAFVGYHTSVPSAGRELIIRIDGDPSPDLPLIHAKIAAGSNPTVINQAKKARDPDRSPKSYAVSLNFGTLLLVIVTAALLIVVIALVVILTVANCRVPSKTANRRAESNQKLLAMYEDWGREGRGLGGVIDEGGIPVVLNQGTPFKIAPSF